MLTHTLRRSGTSPLGGILIGLTALIVFLLTGALAPSPMQAADTVRRVPVQRVPVQRVPVRRVPVPGQDRLQLIAGARQIGRVPAGQTVSLTLALPLRDQAGLADLLGRLYDPHDPLYGHYLTPKDFTARFGPSLSEISTVSRLAKMQGLSLKSVSPNRTLLGVTGPASAVEAAFGVHLVTFVDAQGRRFQTPDRTPTVPSDLAGHLLTVIGLDTAPAAHPFMHRVTPRPDSPIALPIDAQPLTVQPAFYSSNPAGLTPADIHTIYNVPTGTGHDGSGQTLAVFELDTYYSSDITAYEAAFGLPSPALQNIGVDGFDPNTTPGGGQAEVNLDIELEIAMCPAASSVLVYEAANTFAALVDEYNQIANDDLASVISSSWGIGEDQNASGNATAENQIFEQMAAQGQTMTAAAGDGGAYSDGDTTLSCDDPGSQPYVLGVGGTNLSDASSGGAHPTAVYTSESSWGDAADTGRGPEGTGGGGGISHIWAIPSWQVGAFSTTVNPQGSTTMRNVPDVSLDGDYDVNGYAVYLNGSFAGYNGTSAASPVWAGLFGLVNQQRAAGGANPIGFATPAIYAVGKNATKYAADFHDIADGSNNLYYNAVTGYDDSTGWGSFIASALIPDLVPAPSGQPVITSLSPATAAAGSAAFTLTVNGSNFAAGTQIAFGGHLLTTTVVSAVKLQATVAAAMLTTASVVPVTADNPASVTASNAVSFTITPTAAPTITSFTPTTGPAGTSVIVTGTNFVGVTSVKFHGTTAAFAASNSGNRIVTSVPAGATTGTITVTTSHGTGTSGTSFVIPTPPAITSFTPTSGPVATSVTLTGHGFTGASAVTFNGVSAPTFTVVSDTQLTVTVPQYATTGKIVVTTGLGTATSTTSFTVTAPAAPTITSFTPTSGFPGTVVTLTGTNFFSVSAVRFHNASATVFSPSGDGTQLTVTVPSGAATGTITVTTPGGVVKTATPFMVLMPPSNDYFVHRIAITATIGSPGTATGSNVGATLESGEPLNTSGSGGHTVWWSWTAQASGSVTIDTLGSSFDTTLGVYTGTSVNALTLIAANDDINYPSVPQSSVTFNAVAGTQYQISVDGYSSNEGTITVHVTPMSPPAITSFTPTSGPVATSVTLTGHGFTGASAVTFNGVSAPTFTVVSDTQLTVTVPQYATTGKIVVTTGLGTATSTTSFTVTAPAAPTITSFTPTSGFPGTVVTLTGTNFFSVSAVRFHNASATVFSPSGGGTQLTVTVPSGAATGTITVTTPGGVVKTATPFMVLMPPSNDTFANRTSITATASAPGTATGSNVGATLESGEPLNTSGSGGHTVWWSWTAQASGSVTIDTLGSSFDTTLGVYTGTSVSALTLIASDDDYNSTLQSGVTFTAVAGTQYQISVDGYSTNEGSITLHVTPSGP